jgi:hypothetical protein
MTELWQGLLKDHARDLARAFDDPETIAKKTAEWAQANLPESISSALWITVKGDRDEGIEIALHELTLGQRMKVRFGALIGGWSAGLSVAVPVWKRGAVTASAGIGAVVRLESIEPVLTFTLRF